VERGEEKASRSLLPPPSLPPISSPLRKA